MKILMLSILPVVLLACNVPMEEPAELITPPPVGPAATCDPYQNCAEQGPCTCPSGFVCGVGKCVRSASPYKECNSNADCNVVHGTPSPCWQHVCYNAGQPGAGCGYETLSGGQSCKKPNGGNGTCAFPPNDGDCI